MSGEITAEQREALKIAAELIEAGVPIFAAAPNSDKPGEYHLPKAWEQTRPDLSVLDRWRPGWALAAVGGHVADFLDIDPRGGGRESEKELRLQGHFPRSFGRQETPSGGDHHLISATGERKSTGFMPGLDLQSGGPTDEHGKNGRGFVYIAPTVRPSKAPETLGEMRAYRWVERPDMELLADFAGTDETIEGVVARVHARRAPRENNFTAATGQGERPSSLFGGGFLAREFTRAQAEEFCSPYLEELARAPIGEIEERCNVAAAVLSHFVPALWDVDTAYAVLNTALAQTAYNGATWDVSKFLPVLDGRRPPADNWKASLRIEPAGVAAAFGAPEEGPAPLPRSPEEAQSAVQALLDKMLTADEMTLLPAPEPLVWELLDRDSLAALVGAPGSFKSFVALDIAAHVARGLPWRGRKTFQGPVIYIAAEGARGMTMRIRAWQERHGAMGDGIRFLPLPVQIRDVVAWQTLVEVCRAVQPVLVVVDTQAMVSVGIEENSNTDMGVAIDAFKRVQRATKACVLVVHHLTKDGASTRGAGAQDGAQDTRLRVDRIKPRSSLKVRLLDEKQKDMAESGGEEGLTLGLQVVDLGEDPETGRKLSSLVLGAGDNFTDASGQEEPPEDWEVKHPGVQGQILRVLREQGVGAGLTKAETKSSVADRWYGGVSGRSSGLRASTFHTAWNTLIDRELIVNVKGEKWAIDEVETGAQSLPGQ